MGTGGKRRAGRVAAAAVLCCLLAGCTVAVAGSGQVAAPEPVPAGPSVPAAPPPGAPAPEPARVDCPSVSDPAAGLSFHCVTPGLKTGSDPIWTLNLTKSVERDWVLAEGALELSVTPTVPLRQIVGVVRQEMVVLGGWGPSPGVRTLEDKATTVAGVPAQVLGTEFTIDADYRAQQKLTVRTERTWIVALRVDDTHVALWYVTLPDLVDKLWPTVPALIKSIKLD